MGDLLKNAAIISISLMLFGLAAMADSTQAIAPQTRLLRGVFPVQQPLKSDRKIEQQNRQAAAQSQSQIPARSETPNNFNSAGGTSPAVDKPKPKKMWYPMCIFVDVKADQAKAEQSIKDMIREAADCDVAIVPWVRKAIHVEEDPTSEIKASQAACDALDYGEGVTHASVTTITSFEDTAAEMCDDENPNPPQPPAKPKPWNPDTAGCAELSSKNKAKTQAMIDELEHKGELKPGEEKTISQTPVAPSIVRGRTSDGRTLGHEALGHSAVGMVNGSCLGNGIGYGNKDGAKCSAGPPPSGWSGEFCEKLRENSIKNYKYVYNKDRTYIDPETKIVDYANPRPIFKEPADTTNMLAAATPHRNNSNASTADLVQPQEGATGAGHKKQGGGAAAATSGPAAGGAADASVVSARSGRGQQGSAGGGATGSGLGSDGAGDSAAVTSTLFSGAGDGSNASGFRYNSGSLGNGTGSTAGSATPTASDGGGGTAGATDTASTGDSSTSATRTPASESTAETAGGPDLGPLKYVGKTRKQQGQQEEPTQRGSALRGATPDMQNGVYTRSTYSGSDSDEAY